MIRCTSWYATGSWECYIFTAQSWSSLFL